MKIVAAENSADQLDQPAQRKSVFESVDVGEQINRLVRQLAREFAGQLSDSEIARHVHQSVEELGPTRVQHFVPVLVERIARRRITDALAARNDASLSGGRPHAVSA